MEKVMEKIMMQSYTNSCTLVEPGSMCCLRKHYIIRLYKRYVTSAYFSFSDLIEGYVMHMP